LQNSIESKTEKTIAKVVLGLIGLWLISWTPYATIALCGISGHLQPLSPGMAMLPALFAKLSACINPYLYALRHPKVQKEVVRRWCQSCLANPPSTFELSNAMRAENNVSEAKVRGFSANAADVEKY
jgi:r-opsin